MIRIFTIRSAAFFDREIPERSYLIRLYDDAGYPLGKLYSTQTAIGKRTERTGLAETRWIPGHPGHRSFNGCGR